MPGGLRTARHCIFTDGAWTARGGCRACFLWKRRRSGGRASPLSLAPLGSSPKGRVLGITAKFPGRPQSLRVRLLPLGGAVARSAAEGVIWVRTPSVIAARCHLPHGGRHWQYTKASGQTAKLTVSPEPLPLGEVSPQVTERVPSREKVDRENPQIFPIYKL